MITRHLSLILIATALFSISAAGGNITYIRLDDGAAARPAARVNLDLGYDHSLTSGSNIFTQMVFDTDVAEWAALSAGLRISTSNLYQAKALADFNLNLGAARRIGLRNQYNYSLYASGNMQTLDLSLLAVYDQEYISFAAGWNYKLITPIITTRESARSYVWEPNFIYDAALRVFRKAHLWNIGMQITNVRDFTIERMYSPSFYLTGNYRFGGAGTEHINLYWKVGAQPIGIFLVAANNYYLSAQIGITCNL